MDDKIKAAYALNLWTVSVAQIIDYNDVYVLEQEYDNIMNNLNLEHMPKDEALLEIIKEILDQITYLRMDEGDKAILEKRYQHQLKNAVWSAVPNVGAIFATSDPIALGITLATQVGIGYMNYRRNKAEHKIGNEESQWEIQKHHMQHLHSLQNQLFETAWRMADEYQFPDEYRLTANQIKQYNDALMESNLVRRYSKLDGMRRHFAAYPAFWYHMGSTANCIFRSHLFGGDYDSQSYYRSCAIESFEKYKQLNQFNLLRNDVLTASWALEYLELLDLNFENNSASAKELIEIAEQHSGNKPDVLELCAFAYLRIRDEENAARLLHILVNNSYNEEINAQILSGLYIKKMRSQNSNEAMLANVHYKQLFHITGKEFILDVPPEDCDISQWKPDWNREQSFESFVEERKNVDDCTDVQSDDENLNPVGARVEADASEYLNAEQIEDIAQNEKRVYENRVLDITGSILCAGELKFVNCIIRYGLMEKFAKILVEEGGGLQFERCRIEGHSVKVDQCMVEFQHVGGKCTFVDCHFVNCCGFLATRSEVLMEQCTVENAGIQFIGGYDSWRCTKISIKSSLFAYHNETNFVMGSSEARRGAVIHGQVVCVENCAFRGDFRINSAEEAKLWQDSDGHDAPHIDLHIAPFHIIRSYNIVVKSSIFSGINNIIECDSVRASNNSFLHCANVFSKEHHGNGKGDIHDCSFTHCTVVSNGLRDAIFVDCKFYDCYNSLVHGYNGGGIEIESCEFRRWTAYDNKDASKMLLSRSYSMLNLREADRIHRVSNCSFSDIAANNSFVIAGKISGNVRGYIADVNHCTFTNCTTRRRSGKLIKENGNYYGLFNRIVEKHIVYVSADCTGWKNVKQVETT